jgi:hypothetical protein
MIKAWLVLLWAFQGVHAHAAAALIPSNDNSGNPVTSFYVDAKNGDDARDGGAPERAWKTLKKASQRTYGPGESLLLKRGSQFEGGLKLKGQAGPGQAIRLATYGEGPRPLIQGLQDHAISAAGPISGWKISGLELTSTNQKNLERHIEGGTCGIYFGQTEPCQGLRIEDCLIHDTSGPGIYLRAWGPAKAVFSDTVIEHCQIQHASCGIQFAGKDSDFHTEFFTRFRIAYVDVWDIGGDGIVPFCSNNGVVEYCKAWRTGMGVHPKDHSPVGIWFAWSKDSVIQFCEAWDNRTGGLKADGGGFDIDGGCTRCVLQYNYSHDNEGAGYLLCSWDPIRWPSTDCICRFNISVNDGLANDYASICFWQADRFQVYNNTCITRRASPLKFISDTKGHLIANNLFVVETVADLALVKSTFDLRKNEFKNNIFWRAGGGERFETPEGNVRTLADFDKYVKGKGQQVADPAFVKPLLYDYRLRQGSAALGAGIVIKGRGERDFYGATLQTGRADVGAAGLAAPEPRSSKSK